MIYLAGQYSDPEASVRQERADHIELIASKILQERKLVFSPITMMHGIAEKYGLPTEFDYWKAFDEKVLSICSEFWIVHTRDWRKSKGVESEWILARKFGLPCWLVSYDIALKKITRTAL